MNAKDIKGAQPTIGRGEAPARRAYQTPKLVRHGAIKEFTASGSTGQNEGPSMIGALFMS
jgi:hypothetical protein